MIPENPNQVDSPILLGSRIMSSFIVSYRKYTWSLSGDGIQSRLDCTPTPLTSFCTLVFSPVKCESTLSFHCCPKPDDGASLPPWMNECIKWMNTRESEHWSSGHGGSKWLSQSSAHFGGGPRTRGWLSGIWSDVGKKCSLLVWGIIPFSENVLLSNSWNDPILYHLYTEKLNLLSVAGPGAQLAGCPVTSWWSLLLPGTLWPRDSMQMEQKKGQSTIRTTYQGLPKGGRWESPQVILGLDFTLL